jgi:hypothetical protein
VARLNWISGDVAFQPATVDDWSAATLNYPLTTGDHLFVNQGARAELHIGGSAIRINSNSNFGFLNLDDSIVQMSLNEGSLEIRLRQLDRDDAYEIDTPNGAVTLLRAGEYRIDADPARNATMVTVRSGQAQMFQDGNSSLITPHQTAWFHDGGNPEMNTENPRDDFDTFVVSRDRFEDGLPRNSYVPDSMVGYQDLYAYGRWTNDPMYGDVWVPPVTAGWTPYSTGRWAFVEPWGWTWIDEAPWGFAPFHYGRWVSLRGAGWVWIPGERSYRPVYSPALVGFIGGGGFGVSVGWFPLGPREPWIPAWGASRGYVNNVNVMHVRNINVVNVTNVTYVNRQNVTVVSRNDFASARPVRGAEMRLSPGQIQNAQVLGTGPQVVPARGSVAIGASHSAPQFSGRAVVARTPPPPAPVAFEARQQALSQNRGLPLNNNQVQQLRAQQPAAVVNRPAIRSVAPQGVPAQAPPMNRQDMNRPDMNRPGANRPAPSLAPAQPAQTQQAPAQQAPAQQAPARQPMDRMNGRPPNVQQPAPAVYPPNNPPVQARPMQPAERPQPTERQQPIERAQPSERQPQRQQQQQQEQPPAVQRAAPSPAPAAPPAAGAPPNRQGPTKQTKKEEKH